LRIDGLGRPSAIPLSPPDLLAALDILLWPATKKVSTIDTSVSSQFSITGWLGTVIDVGVPDLTTRIGQTRGPRQAVSNAVAMLLFLFQSLLMGEDTNVDGEPQDPQPGLGSSFYVPASYAYSSTRATPAFWTIMAYAGVGGFLLIALLLGEIKALRYEEADKSAFPLLELGTGLKVVEEGPDSANMVVAQAAEERSEATLLKGKSSTYGVLNRAKDLRVVARLLRSGAP
jgi:hypothetical protein